VRVSPRFLTRCCSILLSPLGPLQRCSKMLKKSASSYRPCRVKRKTCEKGAIRSSKFGVRSSGNLALRTSNPPSSRPTRQSCSVIQRRCSPIVTDVRTSEFLACQNSFSTAC
jgi:hypothetical protein